MMTMLQSLTMQVVAGGTIGEIPLRSPVQQLTKRIYTAELE